MKLPTWLHSSPARRRITVVGTTVACLLLAEWAIRADKPTLSAYTVRHFSHKTDAVLNRTPPKIVLIGSSRTYFALVPQEFETLTGCSAFNLGVPLSKTVEWRVMCEHLLPALRPRLTVLGLNAGEFRSDDVPTYAARYLFTLSDLIRYLKEDGWSRPVLGCYVRRSLGPVWAGYDLRFESRMWIQERLAWLLPKYAQEAKELRLFQDQACPFDGYEHPWLKGRHLWTLPERAAMDVADNGDSGVPPFSRDAAGFAQLDKLLAWFKQQELPLLVAYLPNSPGTEARWSRDEPWVTEAIAGSCERHDVPFLSFRRDEVPRTDADYADEFHVGLPLARRLSRRIAEAAVARHVIVPADQRLARAPGADKEAR